MLPVLLLTALVQAPAQRDSVEAWRDRFAAVTDSATLAQWERDGIARARADRDNPMRHLELGFLAYRLGEVTGADKHYDDAAGEFEWASELAPDWPYAWYGLGLAELALGEHTMVAVENIRQALGRDRLTKAARAFARATAADPSFGVAVIQLAETALEQRQRARLDVALEALRAATATAAGANPRVVLARGWIERQAGEGDSAWAVFHRYLDAGGDPALGRLELARTAFWLERADTGRVLYYAGAALINGAPARPGYRADIQWIADSAELAAFDALPDAGVHDWLRTFWERRDARGGRAAGARVAEHYRRLFYARRHYGLASRHRFYDITDRYRSEQRDVDDRGVIYIRHGEPDARATFTSPSIEPNESWRYDLPDGIHLFHFAARHDVQDFRLVETLADVFGSEASLFAASGAGAVNEMQALFESRAALDPEYQSIAYTRQGFGTLTADDRRRGRREIRFGTTTDSYPVEFVRPLGATVQTPVVTAADGSARVLAVFAIPAAQLTPQPLGPRVAYPVRVRVAAIPPTGQPVILDTVRTFVTPERLGPGQQLTGVAELPVPAGRFTLSVVLADGGAPPAAAAGELAIRDSLTIPRFAEGEFAISDLVLGDASQRLVWAGPGRPVPLSPLLVFPENGQVQLYFEIHGLDGRYQARLEVRGSGGGSVFRRIGRLFGGGGPAVALEWQGGAAGGATRVWQTVDLRDVHPGAYHLRLRVEGPDGRRVERDVPFRVQAEN